MTTCLDYITRAHRALGTIGAGQAATGNDATDGLQHLQDLINDLPLLRNGEWSETILSSAADYEASDGERITTNGYAATITLPTTYENEDGDTVPMRDLSRVQVIGATHDQAGLWIYSASNGSWAQVDDLALTDESPFGREDDAGLVAILAASLSQEYPGQLAPTLIGRATKQMASFRARFYRDVTVKADLAFYRTSEMGYDNEIEGLTE